MRASPVEDRVTSLPDGVPQTIEMTATPANDSRPLIANWSTLTRPAPAALSLVLLTAALWVPHRELTELSGEGVFAHFLAITWSTITGAIFLTTVSYLLIGVNEAFGLHYTNKPLPFRRSAYVSFVSYSFAHNVGLNLITGGSAVQRFEPSAPNPIVFGRRQPPPPDQPASVGPLRAQRANLRVPAQTPIR